MVRSRLASTALALLVAACGTSSSGSISSSSSDGGAGSAGSGGSAGSAAAHARVFITSKSYPGDLAGAAKTPTGLKAGDILCQEAALAAGLGGTFKVWLSDATTNAIDRIQNVAGGWYTVGKNATKVADDKTSLVAQGPAARIVDERGNAVTGCPWTGTLPDGTKTTSGLNVGSDGTCTSWTASGIDFAVTGGIGPADAPFNVIAGCPAGGGEKYAQCQNPEPLYCFQQ